MENYSLSDIATATGGGMFGGNNEFIWIFALLILFGGGNFGWGNRNDSFSQFATASSQNEILLGQKFDALSRQINQVGDGLCSSTYALNNSIMGEGRALQTQMSNDTASINATTVAQTQKILDAICQNKIETLQSKINSLELAQATGNVVRYPNAWTYNAGVSPFCNCNTCGCSNI